MIIVVLMMMIIMIMITLHTQGKGYGDHIDRMELEGPAWSACSAQPTSI